jgi:hypothetical protein
MLRPIALAAASLVSVWMTVAPASAQTLVPCAQEGDFCRVPYPTRVVYGVPGRSAATEVAGRGVPCSNEVFGDPARGVPKRCAYVARGYGERSFEEPGRGGRIGYGESRHDRYRGPDGAGHRHRDRFPEREYSASAWQTCASENGFCDFGGVRRVRYGVRGRFHEGTYRNGTSCSNSVFGDPVPGLPKVCQVLN